VNEGFESLHPVENHNFRIKKISTRKKCSYVYANNTNTYIFFVKFQLLPAVIRFPFGVVISSSPVNKKLAGTQGQKEKKCHESVYYKINYLVSANCLFSYDSHR
jgi:hypothetical protein